MASYPVPGVNTRIGFHYFPDFSHFREHDLNQWLLELQKLGASWLTLLAPTDRAIPEAFISGLIKGGIEPIIHFAMPLSPNPDAHALNLLFETYARWGVHYAVLFDQPNSRKVWSHTAWAQGDLVERFLDRFLPLADRLQQAGMFPVFPPLRPGGDYWDTAFLRQCLQSLERRKTTDLIKSLVISAYAPAGEKSLNWGVGGPEQWPATRPYHTPSHSQDQRGLRIFDWYLAECRAILGKALPLILFGMGSQPTDSKAPSLNESTHTQRNLAMAQALAAPVLPKGASLAANSLAEALEPFPPEILAGNFWLLSATSQSSHQDWAWYDPDGSPHPKAIALYSLARMNKPLTASSGIKTPMESPRTPPISHYLLLPANEWGMAEYLLSAARPFIRKYQPTIGFSLAEAALAQRVTVLGSPAVIPEEQLDLLRQQGIQVQRINGDGMSIATFLAEI